MTQEELQEIVVRITPFLGRKESRSITDILTDCDVPLCKEKAQLIFWIVWEWATKQEWWTTFGRYMERRYRDDRDYQDDKASYLVHPVRFLQLVVDFLREKGEKE